MAINSIRGPRRSPRLKKSPIAFPPPPKKTKKITKDIPWRPFRLRDLARENRSTQNLRRSPRLKNASFSGEDSKPLLEELVKSDKISNVKHLLQTGFFEGVPVTCFSEDRQGDVPGFIKGSGFLCGCSQCNYNDEVLSAKYFEKHAGTNTRFQTDHIFFTNGLNLYEVLQHVRGIPEEDFYVKILKLRVDLKKEQFSEEEAPPWDPTKSVTAKRCKRKRRETGFHTSIASVEKNDTTERLSKLPRLEDAVINKSFEDSRQFLKCYKRYNPKRRLMDVQGLLSTGLLEGFRVTYEKNATRLEAYIRDAKYECGCSSCNYTKVITAREIERHARELSKNPNENIFLDNGITLYKLVKELEGIPLYLLCDFLQEKIKCPPNYISFGIWKGSFKTGEDSPNFRSNSDKQPEVHSNHSSAQRDEVSFSEAKKNTDWMADASHVRDDDNSLETLDSNQNNVSTNSNSEQFPVSKPIIACDPTESFMNLAKDSDPINIFQSKSRDEASISESTKNTDERYSSHVRENDSLENLDSYSRQNQPHESTNSNPQQFAVCKPTNNTVPGSSVLDAPGPSILEGTKNPVCKVISLNIGGDEWCWGRASRNIFQSKSRDEASISESTKYTDGTGDSSRVRENDSLEKNTFEPYNVKFNTVPGSSVLDAPGPSILEGTKNPVCKVISLNIGGDEWWHWGRASRKRSPRIIKKRDYNFNVGPGTSLMHGTDEPVQKAGFKLCGAAESTTGSDVTEAATVDPDYKPLDSASKEGLTDEERTCSREITAKRKGRDVYLHKRIFEEGGLPDGTVLTYRYHDKTLLTGYKQGSVIKCACHNYEFAPSQFEAHAGMAQRRQPYRNIYNSDGKTLHELSLEIVPRSISVIHSRPITHRQHKHRKKDFIVPTRYRLKRVMLSQKGVVCRCTNCKESNAAIGDETDPKLMIFCNQCDQAYHVGCLEDPKSFKLDDVLNGNWSCCTDCTWIHTSLKNVCALGAKPVPTPFLDLLKKPDTTEGNPVNLSWQMLRGGNTEDQVLLLQSLQFIKGAFKPIILGRKEMIRQMVFGKYVEGTGLDFRGVLFIMIKLDEEIISIAVLRVFGKYAAELPLATTSKKWRLKGYFRMLLSLIEELLRLLRVRLLVSPVHDKMQSIWIDKFGFVKASDQKVQKLREQHSIMFFEDATVLEREIQACAD